LSHDHVVGIDQARQPLPLQIRLPQFDPHQFPDSRSRPSIVTADFISGKLQGAYNKYSEPDGKLGAFS